MPVTDYLERNCKLYGDEVRLKQIIMSVLSIGIFDGILG